MMGAYAHGLEKVGVAELKAAIDELQWVEFAARTNRMRAVDQTAPHQPVGPEEVLARVIVAHAGEHVEERPLRLGRLIIGRTVTTTCRSTASSSAGTTARSSRRWTAACSRT